MTNTLQQKATHILVKIKTLFVTPEKTFLPFAILFGVLFVFLTPPLQVPDENSHFLRAYQVSDLNFVAQPFEKDGQRHYGAQIPVSINEAIPGLMANIAGKPQNEFNLGTYKEYIRQPLNVEKKESTVIEAAGVYSPVVYIPQAFGISLGKTFDASPLMLIWLGRLVNLSVWILLVYLAIRALPFAKWAFVVLALNPMALFMAASLSPDVINMGGAFLFVSLVLATLKPDKVFGKKDIAVLLGLLSVLALSKPVNLLFAFLLFAIPARHFVNKTKFLVFCIGGFIMAAALFILWNYQIRDILDAAVYSQSGGQHVMVREQLHFILSSPITYLKTIIDNYILITPNTYGDAVLTTFFGVFGWLDTSLPLWVMMAYLLLLFTTLLYQLGRGYSPTLYQKMVFLGVFILGFVGNVTAMYFNATPVGSHTIAGVQGRYFIPFTVLLLIIFTGHKRILQVTSKQISSVTVAVLVGVLLMMTYELASRYY